MKRPRALDLERKGWPEITYDAARVLAPAGRARRAQGLVSGAIAAIDIADRKRLLVDALTEEAITTSKIEGENLDPASVRRSIARRLTLQPLGRNDLRRREGRATEGISAVTVDAVENARKPLTASRLLRWHRMLRPTSLDASEIGRFRTGPMQVVFGPVGRERVHFEAPPGERVESEVQRFLVWFSRLSIGDWLITSALSHLVFVTIHPFADGNGRISRAIADLLLARDVPDDVPVSMTRQILAEKQLYYDMLERTQRGNLDVTEWVVWFLQCYERAALHTRDVIAEVQRANAIFTYAAKQGLNERQLLVLRIFLDRYDGRLNPAKYAQITDKSADTAQRDLADLVAKGVLVRTGATSNVSYDLSPTIPVLARITERPTVPVTSVEDNQTASRTKRP
jgi:Fic family protein